MKGNNLTSEQQINEKAARRQARSRYSQLKDDFPKDDTPTKI
jgi:hypothetical protein